MAAEGIQTQAIFHSNTYIATRQGWRMANLISPGEEIVTKNGLRSIERLFITPRSSFYEISLADGALLRLEGEQSILVTKNGNCQPVEAARLEIGATVCLRPASLPSESAKWNPPDWSDQDFGFAVGVFFANGWRNAGSVGLKRGTKQQELRSMIQWLLSQVGEIRPQAIQIPEIWMNGNLEFTTGLLDGIFSTRGKVISGIHRPYMQVNTPSEKFAYQLRLILLSIGVHSRIRKSQQFRRDLAGSVRHIQHPVYSVSISGQNLGVFQAQIPICHPEQNQELAQAAMKTQNSRENWRSEIVRIQKMDPSAGYGFVAGDLHEYTTDGGVVCARTLFWS